MDLLGAIPCFISITEGKANDKIILDELILEPGAFYIMDRGYIDFGRLYVFTQTPAFFVIRANRNLNYSRRSYRHVDKSTGLRSDQTIILRGPKTSALLRWSELCAFIAEVVYGCCLHWSVHLTRPVCDVRGILVPHYRLQEPVVHRPNLCRSGLFCARAPGPQKATADGVEQ